MAYEDGLPFEVTVSGTMLPEQIPQLVETLAQLTTALSVEFRYGELEPSAEEAAAEVLLFKSDFDRYGEGSIFQPGVASRAWNCLTQYGRRYEEVKRKQEQGGVLATYEEDWLNTPKWMRRYYDADHGAVSMPGLQELIASGKISELTNFGDTSLRFVNGLIKNKEEKLTTD